MMNLILVITLGLLPVYIFGSGGFQLVDIPVLFLIAIALRGKYEKDQYLKTILLLLPFVIWSVLVNCGYYLYIRNTWFLKGAITLTYDIVLLVVFSIIFTKVLDKKNIKYIYYGLILSIVLCLSLRGVPEEDVERVTLSFNDPNQLGYYAATLMVYVILLTKFKEINNYHKPAFYLCDVIIIAFAHIFLSLCLSRSAMAAFLVLDICLLKNTKNLRIFLPVVFCGIMASIFMMYVNPHFLEQRIAVRGEESYTENALTEGFKDRTTSTLNYLEGIEWLVGKGSGPGLPKSVMSTVKGSTGEAHNIFFDALRSYGLIGLGLLAFWFLKAILSTWKMNDALFIWMGLLAYNMGNNGVRFRPFWIVLALLFAMTRYVDKSSRITKSSKSSEG
jgi:hypothetical protein